MILAVARAIAQRSVFVRALDLPRQGGQGSAVEGVNVGVPLEAARLQPLISIWHGKPVNGDPTVGAGSLFVRVDSPLGPLTSGVGYANRDNIAVYLYLGRP